MSTRHTHHAPDEERTFPQKRYIERRRWIDQTKIAAGCKDCGVNGPAEVLTFDHVRGEKKFGVGQSWNQGRAALEEEMAKCEIVCANCHAIRTKQRGRSEPEFVPFEKIYRLSRTIVVTEKIDGTSGTVWVDGEGDVWAASRNRWLSSEQDHHGFAAWVAEHAAEFAEGGPNVFRGEWWGSGIGRRYGLSEKRFSLFNVERWSDDAGDRPPCCGLVPVLYSGPFDTTAIDACLSRLRSDGSVAVPGFLDPEGVVVFHSAANTLFKKTLRGDEHKGEKDRSPT